MHDIQVLTNVWKGEEVRIYCQINYICSFITNCYMGVSTLNRIWQRHKWNRMEVQYRGALDLKFSFRPEPVFWMYCIIDWKVIKEPVKMIGLKAYSATSNFVWCLHQREVKGKIKQKRWFITSDMNSLIIQYDEYNVWSTVRLTKQYSKRAVVSRSYCVHNDQWQWN